MEPIKYIVEQDNESVIIRTIEGRWVYAGDLDDSLSLLQEIFKFKNKKNEVR